MEAMRRMKRAGVMLGVLGLGLTGCGDGGRELRAFEGSTFTVSLPTDAEDRGLTLEIQVAFEGECPSIGWTKAFVNGHELQVLDAGGPGPGLFPLISRSCGRPLFGTQKTARELGLDQELSRIELVDGDFRRIIEGRWLSAPRELRWMGPGPMHSPVAGQALMLEVVGPPGDTLSGAGLSPYTHFNTGFVDTSWISDPETRVIEGRIFRSIAPREARAVPGHFEAEVQAFAEVTRCEGMEPCRLLVTYHLEQDLTPGSP